MAPHVWTQPTPESVILSLLGVRNSQGPTPQMSKISKTSGACVCVHMHMCARTFTSGAPGARGQVRSLGSGEGAAPSLHFQGQEPRRRGEACQGQVLGLADLGLGHQASKVLSTRPPPVTPPQGLEHPAPIAVSICRAKRACFWGRGPHCHPGRVWTCRDQSEREHSEDCTDSSKLG